MNYGRERERERDLRTAKHRHGPRRRRPPKVEPKEHPKQQNQTKFCKRGSQRTDCDAYNKANKIIQSSLQPFLAIIHSINSINCYCT